MGLILEGGVVPLGVPKCSMRAREVDNAGAKFAGSEFKLPLVSEGLPCSGTVRKKSSSPSILRYRGSPFSAARHLLLLWTQALGQCGAEQHLPPCSSFRWHWWLLHKGALARRVVMEEVAMSPQRPCLCCRAGMEWEPSLGWACLTSAWETCANNNLPD